MKISFSHIFLVSLSTITFSQWVSADATVVYEQVAGAQKSLNTMQIKNGIIRFNPPQQENSFSLFNSKTHKLTHIDGNKKQYLEMDENSIEQQAKQAQQQMKVMRERMMEKMKDMPAEKKEQMMKMMGGHLPGINKKPTKVLERKNTNKTETVSNMTCTIYESYLDKVKHSESCVAKADNLGLSADDAEALISMQQFMKKMQKMAQSLSGEIIDKTELHGIPLHTTMFKPDGSIQSEILLTKISTEPVSDELISIPKDFTVMQMPEMPKMK